MCWGDSPFCPVAQDFAQGRHLYVQGGLLDHESGPHAIKQRVLADEMASLIDHRREQVERARAQRDRQAVLQEPSLVEMQLESAEALALE
jgi:hypothetical protein